MDWEIWVGVVKFQLIAGFILRAYKYTYLWSKTNINRHSISRCDRDVIYGCCSQSKANVITAAYLVFCNIITYSLYTHYVALSLKGQVCKAELVKEW